VLIALRRVIEKKIGKLLSQRGDFGPIADHDVRIEGVIVRVVLMVILGSIKPLERRDLGNDRPGKYFRLIELRNIGVGNAPLAVIHVEDCGAIRRAHIGPLAVELRGIVSERKEDAQQCAVGNSRGIVDNLDRFCMTGGLRRDLIVGGSRR
jgi:hypothetical protein